MPKAGPDALARVSETIRQLRAIPQVRERAAGTFELLGRPFAQFVDDGGRLSVELRKASGSGTESFPVDDPAHQRRLVDEAKRRATKILDDQ